MTGLKMYNELTAKLKKTRRSFVDVCKELDIDPKSPHLQILEKQIQCCDNCGMWDSPKTMTVETDGTLYCNICIGAESMRW